MKHNTEPLRQFVIHGKRREQSADDKIPSVSLQTAVANIAMPPWQFTFAGSAGRGLVYQMEMV